MSSNKFLTTAQLINKTTHNEKYLQCSFELISPFVQPFLAGQYVSLKIGPQGELRSYSICSSPTEQRQFDLMIDVTPHGIGTTFLTEAEIGTTIEVLGPLGRFTLEAGGVDQPVFLIGTGSGVAPLRSMVLQLLRSENSPRHINLLWGERFAKDAIWLDEFRELGQQFPNFKFNLAVSRPEEPGGNPTGVAFIPGRVTAILETWHLPEVGQYYLCGNKDMIVEVMQILANRGVPESTIFQEKFY